MHYISVALYHRTSNDVVLPNQTENHSVGNAGTEFLSTKTQELLGFYDIISSGLFPFHPFYSVVSSSIISQVSMFNSDCTVFLARFRVSYSVKSLVASAKVF